MTTESNIRDKALELGFDLAGIAPADRSPTASHYFQWLENGYQAEMHWMENRERRSDPHEVLPAVKSIIVVGQSYFLEDPLPDLWNDPLRGRIARYAWGPDYHDVITPKLKALCSFIQQEHPESQSRYYVDTGPVLERSYAALSGLSFVGKNTLVISPSYGSYVFLGVILTDRELSPTGTDRDPTALAFTSEGGDEKTATCGSCTRCLTACPTHAFPASYVVNSDLCISYLTIELKDAIPETLRSKLGNWIYGCDVCQEVCPWVHRYAKPSKEPFLKFDPDFCTPRLTDLLALDDEGFRDRFRGTPMKRTKRRGILRNAAVALGNSGDPSAKPALEKVLNDPEPLIREHAAWALERL